MAREEPEQMFQASTYYYITFPEFWAMIAAILAKIEKILS